MGGCLLSLPCGATSGGVSVGNRGGLAGPLTHPSTPLHTLLRSTHTTHTQLLERTLRVDHKAKYALPKEIVEKEEQKEKEVSQSVSLYARALSPT